MIVYLKLVGGVAYLHIRAITFVMLRIIMLAVIGMAVIVVALKLAICFVQMQMSAGVSIVHMRILAWGRRIVMNQDGKVITSVMTKTTIADVTGTEVTVVTQMLDSTFVQAATALIHLKYLMELASGHVQIISIKAMGSAMIATTIVLVTGMLEIVVFLPSLPPTVKTVHV
jgi:hypothetical protein